MSTILQQYLEQRGKLTASYIQPTRITFNAQGYEKAMRENDTAGSFRPSDKPWSFATYDGLPYSVVNDQPEEVKLHNAMTDPSPQRQSAITVKIDGIMSGAPVAQIVAANLKAAQLCDIIRAWLDQEDATHWGDFEKALDKVMADHGTFE